MQQENYEYMEDDYDYDYQNENIEDDEDECKAVDNTYKYYKNVFSDTPHEKKVFKAVDRKKEDKLVEQFRNTNDFSIMKILYEMREPTLWVCAKKFAWLDNEDDMFSEFKIIWSNCIRMYDYEAKIRPVRTKKGGLVYDENGKVLTIYKRTPFNTYLFTSIRNRAWNIIKRKHCKKMLDVEGNSILDNMMSLDYEYGDDENLTLHDSLKDNSIRKIDSYVQTEEIIKELSNGDNEIASILRRFATTQNMKKISTACNLCSGKLSINQNDFHILNNGTSESKKLLEQMIRSTGKYTDKFKILNYTVSPNVVYFDVEAKNGKVFRKIQKAMKLFKNREMRFNKKLKESV